MNQDTICSISTPVGTGAISIIRISGNNAIQACNAIFKAYNDQRISEKNHKKVVIGQIVESNTIIDEVVITCFISPHSYTGENLIEIACHGSDYIQKKIIQLLLSQDCRLAKNGEFTLRAFLSGKLDLSQAEGVAELIASDNDKSHDLAMKQMRGGFSNEIQKLRSKFIKFASLIELELDFSEEDVEFADRIKLMELINEIKDTIQPLLESFKFGNAIKHGIPISIVGHPNAGKSTLLNTILNEERAIVSDIKGTTRDTIEEIITHNGYKLRFIDTAGIHSTDNQIEKIGISKTFKKMSESAFILYLIDKTDFDHKSIEKELQEIQKTLDTETVMILVANKYDLNNDEILFKSETLCDLPIIYMSAINGQGINKVFEMILSTIETWKKLSHEIILINQRHYESLIKTLESIDDVTRGLQSNLSGELLSIDIKRCLEYLGEITGEITNENLLDSIFKDFCIGK